MFWLLTSSPASFLNSSPPSPHTIVVSAIRQVLQAPLQSSISFLLSQLEEHPFIHFLLKLWPCVPLFSNAVPCAHLTQCYQLSCATHPLAPHIVLCFHIAYVVLSCLRVFGGEMCPLLEFVCRNLSCHCLIV